DGEVQRNTGFCPAVKLTTEDCRAKDGVDTRSIRRFTETSMITSDGSQQIDPHEELREIIPTNL
ncbi:MAG: hypothetical protein ABIO02_04820, partial [Patescibacteria group bacterium]